MATARSSSAKEIVALFLLTLILFLLHAVKAPAENVGVGTNTPQARLDVLNSIRIGGGVNYLSYDSLSGKFNWNNSYLFATANQALIKHSAFSPIIRIIHILSTIGTKKVNMKTKNQIEEISISIIPQ